MQTLEITFQKNYHTSLEDRFLMETLIIKVQADTAGEDAQVLWDKARQEAELNHRRNNPHLYKEPKKTMSIYESAVALEMPLADQIRTCNDKAVLEKTYKFIVKGKPDLEKIYSEKLKELQ